jgi:hypothetical protein
MASAGHGSEQARQAQDDRKRAECLLAGENRVLEMTAKGSSLESILEALCRVVEQTAGECCCSVVLNRSQWHGNSVRRKTQVVVSDVASDAQWDAYGWRTAALAYGLKETRHPVSPPLSSQNSGNSQDSVTAISLSSPLS